MKKRAVSGARPPTVLVRAVEYIVNRFCTALNEKFLNLRPLYKDAIKFLKLITHPGQRHSTLDGPSKI